MAKSTNGDHSDRAVKIVQRLPAAETLGLWGSVPLGTRTYVFLLSCASKGLAIGRSVAQEIPPDVYKQDVPCVTTQTEEQSRNYVAPHDVFFANLPSLITSFHIGPFLLTLGSHSAA